MDSRNFTDPLDAERTRRAVRRRLFGGPEEPLRVGRFTVIERIGAGGMGAVYTARDPELSRDVALKILHAGGASGSLLAEAKALARLRHPNVVSVYEIGSFSGHTFIAMEHVAGPSLRAWLREKRRKVSEVIAVFASAGQGLVAAHAAGLVHGDFKPDNVLVDADGQARVVDFGLARDQEEGALRPENAPPAPLSAPPEPRLAGTPAYMAPELFEGQPATAATDQFAFCASLHEALFGRLPAPPQGKEPEKDATGDRPAREPASGDVPVRVRATVLRGLSAPPDARHPSMAALLAALGDDPWRRRAPLAAGALAVAIGAITLFAVRANRGPTCDGGEALLEGVWDSAARASLRAAFASIQVPYSTETHTTVERGLDAYATEWAAMHEDSCRATHVRGEQSGELLDLRARCLSRRRDALREAVRALSAPDARLVQRSVALVEQLPPVSACGDAASLKAVVPPPDEPGKRARLAELEPALEAARTTFAAGKLPDALEKVNRLLADARDLDHRPFLAEVLFVAGEIAVTKGDYPGAEAALSEAVKAGQATGHTRIVAQAAVRLVGVTGIKQPHFDKANVWIDVAEASTERSNMPELRALLDNRVGAMLAMQGKNDESLARMVRSIAAMEKLGRTETATFAGYLGDFANVLDRAARHDDAMATFQRALALQEKLLGKVHPSIANTLNSLAIVLERKRRFEEARAAYQRALDIADTLGGIDGAAGMLDNLAGCLYAMGRTDEAFEKRKRALAMRQASLPPGHPQIAMSWNNIGQAHYRAKQYDEALAATEKGLEIRRAAYAGDHPDIAESLGNLAEIREAKNQLPEALALAADAVAMGGRTLGDNHPYVGIWLAVQGRIELAMKKPAVARGHLARAIDILASSGVWEVELATARFELARALWESGVDKERARSLAAQAQSALLGAGETDRATAAGTWLKAHPAGR